LFKILKFKDSPAIVDSTSNTEPVETSVTTIQPVIKTTKKRINFNLKKVNFIILFKVAL
jgi:hypothetical protein